MVVGDGGGTVEEKNGFDGRGDVEGPKRFRLHELAENTMRRTFWYLRAVDDERNVLGRRNDGRRSRDDGRESIRDGIRELRVLGLRDWDFPLVRR